MQQRWPSDNPGVVEEEDSCFSHYFKCLIMRNNLLNHLKGNGCRARYKELQESPGAIGVPIYATKTAFIWLAIQ